MNKRGKDKMTQRSSEPKPKLGSTSMSFVTRDGAQTDEDQKNRQTEFSSGLGGREDRGMEGGCREREQEREEAQGMCGWGRGWRGGG